MTDVFIKFASIVALLALLFFGESYIESRGYDRAKSEDGVSIEQQKAQAAATLANEIQKNRTAEQALQTFKNDQEIKDVQHQQTVVALTDRLHGLAGPAGRLRDPNAARCGSGGDRPQGDVSTTASDSSDNPTEAGGLLSAQLSGLLQRLAREADDINVAYASCRADAYTVRAQP
ncbi:MAG: hypothetical protein ACOYB1_09700 [Limnohabitans sp.]